MNVPFLVAWIVLGLPVAVTFAVLMGDIEEDGLVLTGMTVLAAWIFAPFVLGVAILFGVCWLFGRAVESIEKKFT